MVMRKSVKFAPAASLAARSGVGGTAPDAVAEQIGALRRVL